MNIKEYLKEAEMSYREFSLLSGISLSSVFRYAAGRRVPGKYLMPIIEKVTKGRVRAEDFKRHPDEL